MKENTKNTSRTNGSIKRILIITLSVIIGVFTVLGLNVILTNKQGEINNTPQTLSVENTVTIQNNEIYVLDDNGSVVTAEVGSNDTRIISMLEQKIRHSDEFIQKQYYVDYLTAFTNRPVVIPSLADNVLYLKTQDTTMFLQVYDCKQDVCNKQEYINAVKNYEYDNALVIL